MVCKAFQRSVNVGLALAGAGAITMSSVSALPSTEVSIPASAAMEQQQTAPRVVATEVEYVALTHYLEILGAGAVAAVQESLGTFNDDIPAIFDQIGMGQPGGQWEEFDLLRWNHSLLGAALLAPVAPLVVGPFTDAVTEVLAQSFPSHGDRIREELPAAVDYAFARLVGPIVSAIGATGKTHQQYYMAGMAGNPIDQWGALLSAPIHMAEGFLFGGYGDISALITGEVGGERIPAPGLLTPWGQFPEDRTVTGDGDAESDSVAPDAADQPSAAAIEGTPVSSDVESQEEESTSAAQDAEATEDEEGEGTTEEAVASGEADETSETSNAPETSEDTEIAEAEEATEESEAVPASDEALGDEAESGELGDDQTDSVDVTDEDAADDDAAALEDAEEADKADKGDADDKGDAGSGKTDGNDSDGNDDSGSDDKSGSSEKSDKSDSGDSDAD